MSPTATIYTNRHVREDGTILHYAVEMDLGKLDELAIKAAGSKRRQSHLGPVTVRIVRVERVDYPAQGH
jgi:hypothetical protein